MQKFKHQKLAKSGFTLAEVLITLGIIGVVAAMTIATLVKNINYFELKTAWKEDYSIMQQATKQLAADNDGDIKNALDIQGLSNLVSLYSPYLKTIKLCDNGVTVPGNCWAQNGVNKTLNGTESADYYPDGFGMILSNGSYVVIDAYDNSHISCHMYGVSFSMPADTFCGSFEIDVNGAKGPNIVGRDIYGGWINRNGNIEPYGTSPDYYYLNRDYDCKPGSTFNKNSGWICSKYVLQGIEY